VRFEVRFINFFSTSVVLAGTGARCSEWLRHYATNRKVAGSRSDEVRKFFNLPNPSGHTTPWGLLSL
jgi:hypothetical protein